jgi:murein DD-endopeptidase MepM/ murein hydrolase activator NlpD
MSSFVKFLDGGCMAAFALAGAAFLAGCSSDVSGLSNPFQDSARLSGATDPTPTGSLTPPAPIGEASASSYSSPAYSAPPMVAQAPVAPVSSAPLAPVRPVIASSWSPPPAAPSPVYEAPTRVARSGVVNTNYGSWAGDHGATVVVHPGENAAILADRYNVPLQVLIHVNGFVSAAQIRPGERIVIPVYSAANGAPRVAHVASVDEDSRPRQSAREFETERRREVVADRHSNTESHGRTIYHFVQGPDGAPTHGEATKRKTAAEARRDRRQAQTQDGEHDAAADAPRSHRQRMAEADEQPDHSEMTPSRKAPPMAAAPLARPARAPKMDEAATDSVPPAGAEVEASARPDFSWPAHGRIIAGFHPGANDGINIAVPDGTNVRAVDDGVVAYAGDELQGYGNLVLIRHPDGYVSAYANNGEIDVKRGEEVHRGEVIAKSGQSGNVSSPQLHFELRKGQTPVDPLRFLAAL